MPDDALQISADLSRPDGIPTYLQETYWWAYVHPNAVSVFERQWRCSPRRTCLTNSTGVNSPGAS